MKKVDFALVDPLYNVRQDNNGENVEYNLYKLAVIRSISEVSGQVTKPGARQFFPRSSLFCSIRYLPPGRRTRKLGSLRLISHRSPEMRKNRV